MKYIGLISKYDAKVLEKYGKWAQATLEFGMGASTMVFAQSGTMLYSMEPDPYWLDTTQERLDQLMVPRDRYVLSPYDLAKVSSSGVLFDLVFVDGTADQRFPFALTAFQKLKLGGWMMFHDTRCKADLRNMLDVMLAYQNEIGDVKMNMDHSNISGFQKKAPEPAYDWGKAENMTAWMQGLEPPPNDWTEILDEKGRG